MLEKIHFLIAILAAIAVGISGLIFEMEFVQFCITLISVIIVFFIIGLLAKKMIKGMIKADLEESSEEITTEEEMDETAELAKVEDVETEMANIE